jgi:hypothetical protein
MEMPIEKLKDCAHSRWFIDKRKKGVKFIER